MGDRSSRTPWFTALMLSVPGMTSAGIECMHRGGDALPVDAYTVPASRAGEMQQLLDEHGRIRLDPAGDYRRATGIVVRSGQAIFGAAGTRMGRLVVAPGTSNAIVSGVVPDALEFPPSRLRTHDNCFERFAARTTAQAALTLRNAIVENNLFLDAGRIMIDTTAGGRVLNNRFVRTTVHGHSPALQLLGRGAGAGDRNVFLWTNVLSATGDAIDIRGQTQVNFIGLDAEDWNLRHLSRLPAMLSAASTGTLRVFMAQGGDSKPVPDRYMDVAVDRLDLIGLRLYQTGEPAIRLRESVRESVSVLTSATRLLNDAPDSAGWQAYPDWTNRVEMRKGAPSPPMSEMATGTPWEAPVFQPIPDPAGPDWRRNRLNATDSTLDLQRMINEQGVARLPAGLFHISAPLRLKNGQGIIGAGAGRTAIVAKSDDIDLIVGDDHIATSQPISLVLIDITLQGGRIGLRHDARGSGAGAQYVYNQLSHVVFRDMREAGILIDGIYGWDNNLLDEITFLRIPVGIQQKPNPAYSSAKASGNRPGTNYLDKNVCYRCRFEEMDLGLDLRAKRANNLNACVNCLFRRNRHGAIRLQYSGSTVIANSDFIDNGGDPVISSDQPVGIVASRFIAAGDGSLLDTDAMCEGCEFSARAAGAGTIVRRGGRAILINSRSQGLQLGRDISGVIADSNIAGLPPARLLRLEHGASTVLAAGAQRPAPDLLVSWPE